MQIKTELIDSVDNIRSPEGKWLDSSVFRQEGLKFMRNGFYCSEPKGTIAYVEYWDEQLRRCKEGYQVGNHKITGHHYEYLNYSQIQIVDDMASDSKVSKKETKCPDFWDGDFDYYWCLEIAKNGVSSKESLLTTKEEKAAMNVLPEEERVVAWNKKVDSLKMHVKPHPDYLDGGHHMIVGKSRRKGYSYKNAAICANTYNTIRKSITIVGAFDKKYLYPEGTMGMASAYLNFLNKHTAWTKGREFVDKQEHKRASFTKTVNGIKTEAGYMSNIMALTFADNPAVARGKDAIYVLLEEAGAFPNLRESYEATTPGLEAGGGRFITGQIIIFGTGGDMEVGTKDFAEMYYNPIQFNLMPFINIWDENADNSYCGFFHPIYMNMEGFYDAQGNSDVDAAIAHEKAVRAKLIKNSTSSLALQRRVQEWPLCPAEAFLTVSMNDFPIVELRHQYNKVIRDNLHLRYGQPCYLSRGEHGNIVAKPDLDNYLQPIWDHKPKIKDLRGSVVIYEHPQGNPIPGLYKIGFDPYRQVLGASLAAIYVYKTVQKGSYVYNQIVAQYIGRPYSPDEVNRIAEMLAELYGAQVMHENEVTHVKDYFMRRKKLHLLAAQPDSVIAGAVKSSNTKRIYGCHMSEKMKDAGEKYIKEWLLEIRDYDEDGNPLTNLDYIYDPGLLEELMLYNRKGNFDRVMALMQVMFQVTEDEENKEYGGEQADNAKDLLALMSKQFKNNSRYLN